MNLIQQVTDNFPLFEKLHPGKDLLFGFDNSMSHHKRAPDGLDASLLPLKDGGASVPMMRSTTFVDAEGNEVPQSMQNTNGMPKGMKRILQERRKWKNGMNVNCKACQNNIEHAVRPEVYAGTYSPEHWIYTSQCCARYCLSQEPDFMAQKEWLTETINTRGHSIIFFPKYHCELNYIENVWAFLKAYLRKHCTYNFKDFKNKIPR